MKDRVLPRLETHHTTWANLRVDPGPDRTLPPMLSIEVRHKRSPATKGLSATQNGAGMNQPRIIHLSTLFIVPPEKEWKVLLIQKVDPGSLESIVDTLMPRSHRGLPSNVAHIGLGGRLNIFGGRIGLITSDALPRS